MAAIGEKETMRPAATTGNLREGSWHNRNPSLSDLTSQACWYLYPRPLFLQIYAYMANVVLTSIVGMCMSSHFDTPRFGFVASGKVAEKPIR